VTAVAGGGLPGAPGHSLALKNDGTVWAWGYGKSGQLGNGATTNALTPVQVSGLSGITAVAANGNNSYALKTDGTVWAWGDNGSGQLGNGSSAKTSSTPVQVSLSGATGIAAGGAFAFAVKGDGTAWAWGNDSGWQLGDGGMCGRGCSQPIQITGLSGIAAMSGGYTHGLAITSAGTVDGWGQNGSGQLGNGSTSPSSKPVQASNIANVRQAPASASYSYNGDGLRATKTVSGATSQYAWDLKGGRPLTDGSLSYVYGPGNMPLEQVSSSGSALYLHQDQLGTTRFLTDATGAIVATYGYDPYGNLTALTGNVGTAIGYASQYTDAETGFQYLQARYYDPLTGQFISKDPISWATGRPYGYAVSDPTNFTDPSGLDALHDIWKFLSDWATPIGLLASVASLVFGLIPPLFGLSVFFDLLSTAMSVVQAINDAASGNWWEAAIAIAAGIAGSAALFFKLAAKAKEALAAAREGVSLIVYIRSATFALLAEVDLGGMARLAWQLAKVKEIRSTIISKALDAIGALLWALHKATDQSQSNPTPAPQPTPPPPGPQPGPAPAPAC
jgi:RHS repeat-associated protein